MKKWSIPVWILGIIVSVGSVFMGLTSTSSMATSLNKTVENVRFSLFSILIIVAVVHLVLLVLAFFSRKRTAIRVLNTLLVTGVLVATFQNLPQISGVSLPTHIYILNLIGAAVVFAAAVMMWFPSAKEKAKLAAEKEALKEKVTAE